jgi:hypothetical protein
MRVRHSSAEVGTVLNYLAFDLSGRSLISVPDHFRKLARRCRGLSKIAVEPELIEQMRLWAVDLADEADRAERREVERERLYQNSEKRRRNDGLTVVNRSGVVVKLEWEICPGAALHSSSRPTNSWGYDAASRRPEL